LELRENHPRRYVWGMTMLSPAIEALPWQPISPGFALKVLRGGASDDDTRVLLLRLEPGTETGRHRHTGEIHALNLAGRRKILDTDEVIGPGGYLYEPPGNCDNWMAIGDEPVIVYLTARGTIEYLDEHGGVCSRTTTPSVTASYQRFLAERPR
jgi:quercetin dioxygenase-like cupin family protein